MNRLLYVGIASFAVCVCAGCGGKAESSGGLPVFDLEAAIGSPKAFDLSEISDSIVFIALDDSGGKGVVGRISDIRESKNGFFLSNWINPVKFFDKTGKFVAEIGSMGRGPDEYFDVGDMAVDYERDNLYVKNERNNTLAYDSDGRLFAKTDVGSSGGIAYFGDKFISLRTPDIDVAARGSDGEYISDSLVTIIDVFSSDLNLRGDIKGPDRGVNIVFTAFDDDGVPLGASIDLNIMSGNGTDLLIKEGRCDTVFHYGNDNSLEAVYRLDAGKYTLPAEAYGTSPKVVKDKYCVIADVWEGERYLLVPVYNFAADGREEFLIFDRGEPSRRFSAVGPGRQRGIFLDGIAFKPMYIRGNRLVGYMQAPDIAAGSGGITDPGLKTLAATIKRNGNPVIVMATLKK